MEEKKTWWERRGWIAVGGGVILLFIISTAVNGSNNSSSPTTVNTDENQQPAAQETATQASPLQGNADQANSSNTQNPPRNADGTIRQLEINASAGSGNIAFSSEQNYTNCSNDLTVITVDGNGQPVFTKYTDNYSTGLNLFAGDQHSIAYGSLVDSNGDSLAADIRSGMYESNVAGNWGITCDQGQYQLTINSI